MMSQTCIVVSKSCAGSTNLLLHLVKYKLFCLHIFFNPGLREARVD